MRFAAWILLFVCGCTEGVKPNPLPRAGVPAAVENPPMPKLVDGKTLYERLGREDGLIQTVNALVADLAANPQTQPLSMSIRKRTMVEFLMEVSSRPRPKLADDVMLSAENWALVLPALREVLSNRMISDSDRDELFDNIKKSR